MNLSEREWTVLNALWKTSGAELGVLVNELYKETGWNRNTVHTYLTRMEAKGLVRINKDVTPHIYCAMIDRESCQQKERHSFLNRVYSGSTGDLIAAFLKEPALHVPQALPHSAFRLFIERGRGRGGTRCCGTGSPHRR